VLVAAAALQTLVGCRTPTGNPGAEGCGVWADSVLTLCVGQEARAPDGVTRIAFLGVRSDSRCPVDVECVWAGNAEVQIGVAFGMGPTVPYVLNTGLEPRAVAFGTFRLTVAELRPAPVSFRRIPSDHYVIRLVYQRIWAPD
jgi:hypothetical protein